MNRNVMIVDDDLSSLFAFETVLQYGGFQVTAVDRGEKCLEALEGGFKGVILIDIMMPEMDGWETIKEITNRDFLEGNVISIVTAVDNSSPDKEGVSQYITDCIIKPVDGDKLVSIV
ncbi:MAG: response regulator, partial [Chloroflexota bacterium]|nr:response regulator [Chloroflexota bacterium]